MKKDIPVITEKHQVNKFKSILVDSISPAQFNELTSCYYSKSSLLALSKDWRLFNEFCRLNGVSSIPASVTAVRRFLDKERHSRKYSTLRRYAVTIGVVHTVLGFKDPTKGREIGLCLNEIRIAGADKVKETSAFTDTHLTDLHALLSASPDPKDCRDLAIYYVMFECALKRKDLRQLTQEHLETLDDTSYLNIDGTRYILSDTAAVVLNSWLDCNPYAPLFVSIDRHGNMKDGVLDDSSIYRILRRASELLSLPDYRRFSSQSGRVGAVKKLWSEGYKVRDIQEFGRWASPAMPLQYTGNPERSEKEKDKFKPS
ncbi:tyrosine-type recombinase/integrase [Vibrio methylphosphonaticus]|uniref:tyrosine-type recombinase/integrase n=1 Tax=Vibrio methylphosphonaticus TaxID=2946866 RepID=UPI00202A4D1D|nr:tyrosine-type recombinase/integrase [Vibrio methylphosphonaticus]MCL9777225.1 tyrosine-type recombinase/integrase [Vibrio methylphosphonaticus]